ncbi:hypothetical protein [Photobacterium leiognathi]|uniref:hypothetical protein n=1 Tax=Photobacterium leiognathi TaxID=553611 RepID=UPI002982B11E|nr:hypothetical protein [Photobacterium leiognathi]
MGQKYLNKSNIMYACLLILVYLLTHGIVSSDAVIGYYKGSLIPELTGMFLELVIVLLVFNTYQARLDKDKKKEKERVLRKYIIFIIKKLKVFDSVPATFSFYAENHNDNHAVLTKLRDELIDGSEINISEDNVADIVKHCQVDIDAITALLPVASDLSSEHFKAWSRIVFYVKKISLIDTENKFQEDLSKLVDYIKDFDDATSKHKIFNDAN